MCECAILCVSEDGGWVLLRCREARLRQGCPSGSRVHSDLGVRFQPGEGGGQLASVSIVPS